MENEKKAPIRVSVIVPVYNAESYLRTCLDSILQQTLEDIEILAVDDGSKDHSAEILREYEKNYPDTIHAIYQENQGSQWRETMHWRWRPESSWRLWTATIT